MAKINKKFKKVLLTSLLTTGIAVSGFSILNSLGNTSNTNNISYSDSNLQSATSSRATSRAANLSSYANYHQYYTSTTSGNSYAILTGSTNTTLDQITRYDLDGTKIGQEVWTITKATIEGQSATGVQIKSIMYMNGTTDLIYILVSNNTSSWLLSANWSDGNNVAKVKEFTNKNYSTMYLSSSISKTIMLFESKDITNAAASTLNYSIFNGEASTETSGTITIPDSVASSFFSNNASELVDSYMVNGTVYFVYRQKTFTNQDANNQKTAVNNLATVFKVNKSNLENSQNYSIGATEIGSLSLTADQAALFENNKAISVKAVNKDNSNFALVLSQEATDANATSTKTIVGSFTETTLSASTTFTLNSYDLPTGGSISQIKPYYVSSTLNGFLALDSKGSKVIMLDKTTLQPGASAFYSGTNIQNVFTNSKQASWYFQNSTGTISELSGNTLVYADISQSNVQINEYAASVNVKTQSEVSASVLYRKVGTSTADIDQNFKNYIEGTSSYKDFITVSNSDQRFGDPIITGEVVSITKKGTTNNYLVQIDFNQQLRKKATSTSNPTNGSKVTIASTYLTFTNDNANITAKQKNKVPASITNKKASEITDEDVVNYLVDMQNVGSYVINKTADDTKGTLSLEIIASNVWVNGNLVSTQTYNIVFGDSNNPFFMIDLLGGLDGSITGITDQYLENNATLKNQLLIKYSNSLPSEITADDILNDFVVLGNAFSDRLLINQGIVVAPTAANVSFTPIDSEGRLMVTVTVPKVGNKENVVYSFETATLFSKNVTSNQNVYLAFKTNEEVLNYTPEVTSGTANPYKSYTPSQLASLINVTDVNTQIKNLAPFVDASNFVLNMLSQTDSNNQKLLTVSAVANDIDGYLTINFDFLNPLPGSSSKTVSQLFSGFTTKGNNTGSASQFSWGTLAENAFSGKYPSDITENDLSKAGLFVYGGNTGQLQKNITLTPLNNSGALVVKIVFQNWKEMVTTGNVTKLTTIPEKSFETVIKNGLNTTINTTNMVVWKSFDSLNISYKNYTPTEVKTEIEKQGNDYLKLKELADISSELDRKLSANPDAVSMVIDADETRGQINVTARISLEDYSTTLNTKISGFSIATSDYTITLSNDDALLNNLRKKMPSEITEQELGSLVSKSVNNLRTETIKTFDDIKGTLTVTVNVYDATGNNIVATTTREYSGFKTNVPQYKGTDWLIVALAVIIPATILIIPILLIVFYFNRKDKIKFSKKLDMRLSENKNKKKTVNVRTIKDLLDL